MGLLALDSSFLIDLQSGDASVRAAIRSFLKTHADDVLGVSVTVLGEFSAGFEDARSGVYHAIRQRLHIMEHDEEVALTYGAIFRNLKLSGGMIGSNDLWIAASALRHGARLVTRNTDFAKVPGLKFLGY